MASATPQPGFLPRVNAGGSGLEYVSVAELLLAVAASTQPNPADPLWQIWFDTSAVPGGSQSLDALSESVTISETRTSLVALLESRVESVTPAESELDSAATPGAWSEITSETVTISESRVSLMGLPEAHTETVTASEVGTDSASISASGPSYVGIGGVVYSNTGTSLAIPMPSSIAANDILVAVVVGGWGSAPAAPTGWTRKGVDANNVFAYFWKRSTGSEGTTTFTGYDGWGVLGAVYAVRGIVASGDPFEVVSLVAGAGNSTVTTAAITTTNANDFVCALAGFYGSDSDGGGSVGIVAPTMTGVTMTGTEWMAHNPSYTGQAFGLKYGVKASTGSTSVGETCSTTMIGNSPLSAAVLFALKAA